jgi:hypothetical protein
VFEDPYLSTSSSGSTWRAPKADDAAKRLAEILEENGVRGVFKLVGEKLRVMTIVIHRPKCGET